jgi:6-phosphogluconolactonase
MLKVGRIECLKDLGSTVLPADFSGSLGQPLHLTPDGRFMYASSAPPAQLPHSGIDGDSGRLILVGNYPTEKQPRGFNIDPKGKYLLAAGENSNGVCSYEIRQNTGALRKLSHLNVGKSPNRVEIIVLPH